MKEPWNEEYNGRDAQDVRWIMLAVVVISILSLAGVIVIELLRAAGVPL